MPEGQEIGQPTIQQMADEIARLSSLKAAYKQAWSDLEDAIDDFSDDLDIGSSVAVLELRDRLVKTQGAVRSRLEADRG
jgi:hypothetical protein